MFIIVGGVCGCGKTTVAARLASRLGWPMAEADDFHSASNKAKMASGQPLDDNDRLPWLQSLRAKMVAWNEEGLHGVFTCSALKKSYRSLLQGHASDLDSNNATADPPSCRVLIVLLTASEESIKSRMAQRTGHFMPDCLIQSQFSTLEHCGCDEVDVFELNTEKLASSEVVDHLFQLVSKKEALRTSSP